MSSVLQEFENNFVDDYQQLYGMLVVLGLVICLKILILTNNLFNGCSYV